MSLVCASALCLLLFSFTYRFSSVQYISQKKTAHKPTTRSAGEPFVIFFCIEVLAVLLLKWQIGSGQKFLAREMQSGLINECNVAVNKPWAKFNIQWSRNTIKNLLYTQKIVHLWFLLIWLELVSYFLLWCEMTFQSKTASNYTV